MSETRTGVFRGWVLAAVLAALPGIAAAAKAPFDGPVYVTLQQSNAVEVLPSGRLIRGIDNAHYAALSPDGRRLLVTSLKTGRVYVIDTRDDRVLATLSVGSAAQGVKVSPDGRLALAVNPKRGSVAVIDLRSLKVVKTIAVGKTPHNVRFAPDGRLAYVTLQGAGAVAVIDMRELRKIRDIPVPGVQGPHNLDLSDDGHRLWVRDLVGHVAVLALPSGRELAVIKVGLGHAGIDVIPGGRYVFTGAIADRVVDVIDPKTFKVVARIDVGRGPHGVRADHSGRWVYASVTAANRVAVISTRTLKVVKEIPTKGRFPFWVAVRGNP